MELSAVERDEMALGAGVSRRVMAARLITGLLQGVLLYWLYRAGKDGAWPATAPYLMVPLMMLALFLPVLLVSSCLLYTSPSPRDRQKSRMPSSA